MQKHRYEALDGLRGLVAVAVLFHHGCFYLHIPQVFGHGFLGVDFFFVLSGFVIGVAYDDKLSSRRMSFVEFAKARAIRLYPMAALGTLLGFAILHSSHSRRELGFGLALVPMLKDATGNVIFPLDVVLWSLFFELVANFAYALAAPRLRTPGLYAVAAVSFGIFAAHGHVSAGFLCDDVWFGAARTAFSFSMGLLIYRRYAAGTLPRIQAPAWLLVGALLAALALPYPPGWRDVCDLLVAAILSPLVVAAGVHWRAQGRLLRACRLSGELSYPLYALHWPLMQALLMVGPLMALPGLGRLAALGAFAVFSAAFSWGVMRAIDAPVRRRLSAWLAAKPPAVAAPAE